MTVCPPDSGSVISAFLDLISRRCLRQSSLRWATSFSSGSWILCKSNEELMRLVRPKFTWRATDPALNVLIAKSSTANQSKHNKQNTKLAPNFLNLATPLMNRNWSRRHSASLRKGGRARIRSVRRQRLLCIPMTGQSVVCRRRTLPVFCLRLVVGGVSKTSSYERVVSWPAPKVVGQDLWVDFPVQEDWRTTNRWDRPARTETLAVGTCLFSICSF